MTSFFKEFINKLVRKPIKREITVTSREFTEEEIAEMAKRDEEQKEIRRQQIEGYIKEMKEIMPSGQNVVIERTHTINEMFRIWPSFRLVTWLEDGLIHFSDSRQTFIFEDPELRTFLDEKISGPYIHLTHEFPKTPDEALRALDSNRGLELTLGSTKLYKHDDTYYVKLGGMAPVASHLSDFYRHLQMIDKISPLWEKKERGE